MSGKPSPAGAAKLLELLERADGLLVEVERSRKEEKAQREALQITVEIRTRAEEALATTTKAIGALLTEMDCASVGNWGFEGRMGWLMLELRRRIVAGCQPKAHPPAAPPPETVD